MSHEQLTLFLRDKLDEVSKKRRTTGSPMTTPTTTPWSEKPHVADGPLGQHHPPPHLAVIPPTVHPLDGIRENHNQHHLHVADGPLGQQNKNNNNGNNNNKNSSQTPIIIYSSSDSSIETFEFEEIIGKKIENGLPLYHVVWSDGSKSWEPIEHFSDVQHVLKYEAFLEAEKRDCGGRIQLPTGRPPHCMGRTDLCDRHRAIYEEAKDRPTKMRRLDSESETESEGMKYARLHA